MWYSLLSMAPTPQKFREIVLQILYSSDFNASQDEDMGTFMKEEFALSSKSMRLAQERRDQILAKKEEADALIGEFSSSYSLERIPRTERAILRLGVYELLFDTAIPPKVAIAEAIRLARKYATPEGGMFVNAVLDSLYKKKLNFDEPYAVSAEKASE